MQRSTYCAHVHTACIPSVHTYYKSNREAHVESAFVQLAMGRRKLTRDWHSHFRPRVNQVVHVGRSTWPRISIRRRPITLRSARVLITGSSRVESFYTMRYHSTYPLGRFSLSFWLSFPPHLIKRQKFLSANNPKSQIFRKFHKKMKFYIFLQTTVFPSHLE